MYVYGPAGFGDGYVQMNKDYVIAFETTLGLHYDDERASFPTYVAALNNPLIIAKAVLGVRNGLREVTKCVTVREMLVLSVLQLVVIHLTASSVVGVGMRANVRSDEMTTFVWQFPHHLSGRDGHVHHQPLLRRRGATTSLRTVIRVGTVRGPSFTQWVAATSTSSERVAYDDNLSSNALRLDALFNLYAHVQNRNFVTHVTFMGQYEPTDVPFGDEYPSDTLLAEDVIRM
ncbi:TPA: hypothetical protein N0F65_007703 [Lagenidium giganteum]|uniref:Uncharacterized protein n=1 Tax=Lagenidium giganteum TaxID=4803 RepID=A0AAV2Z4U6_9STRA|nr:TPA: hypothetical protein N0F65_007703 [Lagenidium giganteum]